MFTFLLVVHALIAAALVTVILMQRSEGGGLGMGSGPAGLMTARGAADFLSRATGVLATAFVVMALVLATLAATRNAGGTIDTSLAGQAPAGPITAPVAPAGPTGNIPMMGAATPAAPDPLTAQALAPAAGGPPTRPAPAPVRRTPIAADIKPLPTPKAATGGIGIYGVGNGDKPVPAAGTSAPAPAAAGNTQQ